MASVRFKRSKNHQNPSHPREKNISDENFFGRKIFGRKNSDEKNGGQGTGARHGRCGGKARVINGDSWGAKPPRPPRGARHGKRRFLGGQAPPDPPTTPFQKICLRKFFEMIRTAPSPQTVPRKKKDGRKKFRLSFFFVGRFGGTEPFFSFQKICP